MFSVLYTRPNLNFTEERTFFTSMRSPVSIQCHAMYDHTHSNVYQCGFVSSPMASNEIRTEFVECTGWHWTAWYLTGRYRTECIKWNTPNGNEIGLTGKRCQHPPVCTDTHTDTYRHMQTHTPLFPKLKLFFFCIRFIGTSLYWQLVCVLSIVKSCSSKDVPSSNFQLLEFLGSDLHKTIG